MYLMWELDNLIMNKGDSIADHLNKVTNLKEQPLNIDDDRKLITNLLNSSPESYRSLHIS